MPSTRKQNSYHIRSKAKPLRKLICLLLSTVFLFQQTTAFAGSETRVMVSPPGITIPNEFGTIEKVFSGNSGKTMIYIQDAHDSLEAQENIAKIINHLVENQKVETVFEEGHEGPVPSDEYFGGIEDSEIKEKLSYFLMDKLRLGGAEYAHINRFASQVNSKWLMVNKNPPSTDFHSLPTIHDSRNFKLIGIDNKALHAENIHAYQEAAKVKEETRRDLIALQNQLQRLGSQSFPKEIKAWFKLKDRLDHHQLDLLDYLKRTRRLLSRHGSAFQYPAMNLLLEASKNRDGESAERVQAIDAKVLFQEIDHLENDIAAAFLSQPTDRALFKYLKSVQLLMKLNEIEVTAQEYEALAETLAEIHTQDIAQFIADMTHKPISLSKKWEADLNEAKRFYELAHQRDQTLAKNLQRHFKSREESRADKNISVLVFGGFHKSKIQAILKEQNFTVYTVTPKISFVSKRHQDYYKKLMGVGHHSFEAPLFAATAARQEGIYDMPQWNRSVLMHAARYVSHWKTLDRAMLHKKLEEEGVWIARSETRTKDAMVSPLDGPVNERLRHPLVKDPTEHRSEARVVIENVREKSAVQLRQTQQTLKGALSDKADQVEGWEAFEKKLSDAIGRLERKEDWEVLHIWMNGDQGIRGEWEKFAAYFPEAIFEEALETINGILETIDYFAVSEAVRALWDQAPESLDRESVQLDLDSQTMKLSRGGGDVWGINTSPFLASQLEKKNMAFSLTIPAKTGALTVETIITRSLIAGPDAEKLRQLLARQEFEIRQDAQKRFLVTVHIAPPQSIYDLRKEPQYDPIDFVEMLKAEFPNQEKLRMVDFGPGGDLWYAQRQKEIIETNSHFKVEFILVGQMDKADEAVLKKKGFIVINKWIHDSSDLTDGIRGNVDIVIANAPDYPFTTIGKIMMEHMIHPEGMVIWRYSTWADDVMLHVYLQERLANETHYRFTEKAPEGKGWAASEGSWPNHMNPIIVRRNESSFKYPPLIKAEQLGQTRSEARADEPKTEGVQAVADSLLFSRGQILTDGFSGSTAIFESGQSERLKPEALASLEDAGGGEKLFDGDVEDFSLSDFMELPFLADSGIVDSTAVEDLFLHFFDGNIHRSEDYNPENHVRYEVLRYPGAGTSGSDIFKFKMTQSHVIPEDWKVIKINEMGYQGLLHQEIRGSAYLRDLDQRRKDQALHEGGSGFLSLGEWMEKYPTRVVMTRSPESPHPLTIELYTELPRSEARSEGRGGNAQEEVAKWQSPLWNFEEMKPILQRYQQGEIIDWLRLEASIVKLTDEERTGLYQWLASETTIFKNLPLGTWPQPLRVRFYDLRIQSILKRKSGAAADYYRYFPAGELWQGLSSRFSDINVRERFLRFKVEIQETSKREWRFLFRMKGIKKLQAHGFANSYISGHAGSGDYPDYTHPYELRDHWAMLNTMLEGFQKGDFGLLDQRDHRAQIDSFWQMHDNENPVHPATYGPYYAIPESLGSFKFDLNKENMIFVVPDEEAVQFLKAGLEEAVRLQKISLEKAQDQLRRVITMDQVNELPGETLDDIFNFKKEWNNGLLLKGNRSEIRIQNKERNAVSLLENPQRKGTLTMSVRLLNRIPKDLREPFMDELVSAISDPQKVSLILYSDTADIDAETAKFRDQLGELPNVVVVSEGRNEALAAWGLPGSVAVDLFENGEDLNLDFTPGERIKALKHVRLKELGDILLAKLVATIPGDQLWFIHEVEGAMELLPGFRSDLQAFMAQRAVAWSA